MLERDGCPRAVNASFSRMSRECVSQRIVVAF
jgi:hypothetical protein